MLMLQNLHLNLFCVSITLPVMGTCIIKKNKIKNLPSGVDAAALQERHRGQQEVVEAQQLLSVARREHAKSVVQLKQLERKVSIYIYMCYSRDNKTCIIITIINIIYIH